MDRDDLLSTFSDIHKDALGFRPRRNMDHLTDEELVAEIDSLNRFGWQEEYCREHFAARGTEANFLAVQRMPVAELVHRVAELRTAVPTRPTAGEGWALA